MNTKTAITATALFLFIQLPSSSGNPQAHGAEDACKDYAMDPYTLPINAPTADANAEHGSAWIFIEESRDEDYKEGKITGRVCDDAGDILCKIVEDLQSAGGSFQGDVLGDDGCLDPDIPKIVELPDGSQYLDIDLTIPAPT